MRSPQRALPLAVAVASGLATTGLLYLVLRSPLNAPVSAAVTEPMVVAVHVTENEPLAPDALTVVQVAHRPEGAFASIDELKDRLPLVAVPKGQPLLSSHLAASGAKPALWHRIPPGRRAVTIAIDEVVGVGGFLKPGLRVDIVSVARGDDAWETRTIAQDVPILAIAQDDKSAQADTNAHVVPSATLLVSPRQAEAVSLATEQGKIRLVLRAPDDHAIVKLSAQKTTSGLKKAPPAAAPIVAPPVAVAPVAPVVPPPAPAKPDTSGIEVIRGHESEVVKP
jgi:pilus assembly protein CpaB